MNQCVEQRRARSAEHRRGRVRLAVTVVALALLAGGGSRADEPPASLPAEAVAKLGREDVIRLLELQERTKTSLALASRRDLFLREHALGVPVSTVLPAIFLLSLLLGMALTLHHRLRVERLRQETCRLLVSRDQPIPDALLSPARAPELDRRRGILLLAAGAALGLFLAIAVNPRTASAALIPAFIGAAHLGLAHWNRRTRA
jgi:hypothetical protein